MRVSEVSQSDLEAIVSLGNLRIYCAGLVPVSSENMPQTSPEVLARQHVQDAVASVVRQTQLLHDLPTRYELQVTLPLGIVPDLCICQEGIIAYKLLVQGVHERHRKCGEYHVEGPTTRLQSSRHARSCTSSTSPNWIARLAPDLTQNEHVECKIDNGHHKEYEEFRAPRPQRPKGHSSSDHSCLAYRALAVDVCP